MLNITLRGCAKDIDPRLVNPATACTDPLDAPADAGAIWGGDGQGGMEIAGLDRKHNGAYVYTAGGVVTSVQLSGLARVVRDAYQVIGFDGVSGATYTINLTLGKAHDAYIFHFYDQS